jgi:hypothetical protein
MFLPDGVKCRIGQGQRCCSSGCEWKKAFKHYCWLRQPEFKHEVKKENDFFSKITVEHKDELTSKITTQSQDDWIKKIKTYEGKIK